MMIVEAKEYNEMVVNKSFIEILHHLSFQISTSYDGYFALL